MKTTRIIPAPCALLAALALAASAAVPHEWAVDLARPPTVEDVPVFRGETIDLSCAVLSGGRPYDLSGYSATLHWQTNGMPEETWWSAPASATGNVLRATWHPAMDPGVSPVSAFIGARDPRTGALAYRAIMRLRILPAPGATPNELPIPPRRIDFASVEIVNAPWVETETDPTVPAWAKAATPPLTEEVDPIASAWIAANTNPYGAVHKAYEADVARRADSADFASIAGTTDFSARAGSAWGLLVQDSDNRRDAADIFAALDAAVTEERDPVFSAWATNNNSWFRGKADTLRGDLPALPNLQVSDIMNADNQLKWGTIRTAWAATNYTDAAARAATNYTDAAIAAIPAPDLAALVPTNRMVAGVALDADIPLAGRIEVTNNTLRVFAPTNSTSDPVLAWEQPSASAILPALSAMSNLVVALAARVAALEAGGGAAQWADFDAQGNPNPDPDSTLLNRPFAALASGFQWVSSGGCYALAASGAVAFAADTGGEVRLFGSSVSNSVGLHSAGGVVTVGCNATGFVVSGSGQSAVASITYPYSGGDYPVIYGATSPAGPWTEMTAATWEADADAGTATASFPAVATGYFYRATTSVELGEYWHARIPSLLEGGILTSGSDISPVVYDTTITITQGGTSYRLPAQTVP